MLIGAGWFGFKEQAEQAKTISPALLIYFNRYRARAKFLDGYRVLRISLSNLFFNLRPVAFIRIGELRAKLLTLLVAMAATLYLSITLSHLRLILL
jgi:hypothetical protein